MRRLLIFFFAGSAAYGLVDAIFLGEPLFGLSVVAVTGYATATGIKRERRSTGMRR